MDQPEDQNGIWWMTNDPNFPYNPDDFDEFDESSEFDDFDEYDDSAEPGDLSDQVAQHTPAKPVERDSHSIFEVRTFDTQNFEVVARTVAWPESSAPRPATPAPKNSLAAGSPAPSVAVDRRAQPASSVPASARRAGTRPAGARSERRRGSARNTARAASVWWSALRTMLITILAAILLSTIFSLWTSPTFFTDEFRAGLNRVQATQHIANIQPTPLPTDTHQVRIGIIIGHSGPPQDPSFTEDPGAVCPDGLRELDINTAVAQRVIAQLSGVGYSVDLMAEFDPQLENYLADVLVSIHTNDCQDYGDAGTGYSVAAASSRQTTRGADEHLRDCLLSQYGTTTGLPLHGEVTYDMSEYHNFDEVSPDTPTAIIELGFMNRDRAILMGSPDIIAQGIVNGIQCFFGANSGDFS